MLHFLVILKSISMDIGQLAYGKNIITTLMGDWIIMYLVTFKGFMLAKEYLINRG